MIFKLFIKKIKIIELFQTVTKCNISNTSDSFRRLKK